jgi:3-hydroxyisobutyrate dehydrogenase-like beta-hydroxyacid dehydrogenase
MKIGFIGLGNMGNGMAKNILAKGYEVVGFDIENDKLVELENLGLEVATSVC